MENYINQNSLIGHLARQISENVDEIVQVIDSNFNLLYINEKAHNKLLGYSKDNIINSNLLDLIKKTQRDKVKSKIHKGFRNFNEIPIEVSYEDKNNLFVNLKGKITFFKSRFEEPRSLLVLNVLNSIHQQKKHNLENYRFSEEEYPDLIHNLGTLFFDGANDAIFIMDKNKFVQANKKTLELFGLENKSEILGRTPWAFSPEKQLDGINSQKKGKRLINRVLEGEPQRFDWTHIKKDGTQFQAEVSLNAFQFENKFFVQAIVRDISSKIKAEQKLKESEEKYRHLFVNSPFSIILMKSNGKIIDCNPALEKLTGYSKKRLIGKNYAQLQIIKEDYLPRLIKRRALFLSGKELPPIEIQLKKKNGKSIWVEIESTFVNVGEEKLIQTIGHSISDRKHAEHILKEEYRKLLQLDKMRKDLISRVSHELKTPLMSIKGASELLLLLHNEELSEETMELVEMIEKGGERLTSLVDNLIDISRIEYNKLKLDKTEIDLVKTIEDVSNEMKYLIKKRKLNLILDMPNSLYLNVDNVRIEQVITNILSNAIKNTPPNGEIKITVEKNKKWAKIIVEDTGIGLTDDEMDRIFTRFGKIERHGAGLEFMDIQGSGLGLYISREIVSLHNGKIYAESDGRHKGSTFIVQLPIKKQN
jgi:PAS domain S-box-containing protein